MKYAQLLFAFAFYALCLSALAYLVQVGQWPWAFVPTLLAFTLRMHWQEDENPATDAARLQWLEKQMRSAAAEGILWRVAREVHDGTPLRDAIDTKR